MDPSQFAWPTENIFSSDLPAINNVYHQNVREYVAETWNYLPAVTGAYNDPTTQKYVFAKSKENEAEQLAYTVLNAPIPFYDDTTAARIIADIERKNYTRVQFKRLSWLYAYRHGSEHGKI